MRSRRRPRSYWTKPTSSVIATAPGPLPRRGPLPPQRRRSLPAALRRYGWSYLFIFPTFSLFVVFTLLPVVQGLVLSLQNARVTGGEFIGLANFETLANDPVFVQAVANTILYPTVVGPAQVTLSLVAGHPLRPPRPPRHGLYILALQLFDHVYSMTTGGGPNNATIMIVKLSFPTAFQFRHYGLSSAMAVLLFGMARVVAMVQFRSLRSDVEY